MEEETPASKEYWEIFYTEGKGTRNYEWYQLYYEDIQTTLLNFIKSLSATQILQIGKFLIQKGIKNEGVGNSTVFEQLFEDSALPQIGITFDISEAAIEYMIGKQKEKNFEQEKKQNKKKESQTRNKISYTQMDACNMLEDWENKFHIVFDKGTIDALLSNGKDEEGENEKVKQLLSEVYRVLKPGGKFLLITGNDTFIIHPYIYEQDWNVEQEKLVRKSKNKDSHSSDFAKLNLTLYVLTKT